MAMEPEEVRDMALEALEQWNFHLEVAALGAIRDGKFDRHGASLHLQLGEHWNAPCFGNECGEAYVDAKSITDMAANTDPALFDAGIHGLPGDYDGVTWEE
jgi:hypothetical protein